MQEFFDFLINFAIAYIVFSFIRRLLLRYEETVNEEANELRDKLRKMIHFVKLEKHGDQLYWFDAQTDQFLGQGKNIDEVIAHVKSRFPTHVFVDESANNFLKAPEWKPQPIAELKNLKTVD